MRVLSVNHGPQVRAELFGRWIGEAGHELVEWTIGTEEQPGGAFDAVLVLGGHQNVGEEELHPWLEEEYDLLRGWIASAMPLFAICLGAQTLAHAFGGKVARLAERQAGFSEVRLSGAGERDPVLGVLPSRFEALVGNFFGFEVPPGGVELASSDVQPQAFRIGERAWAVQFHPEARRGQVLGWFEADGEETLPRPLAEIERELEAKIDSWQRLGHALCDAFLEVAASGPQAPNSAGL